MDKLSKQDLQAEILLGRKSRFSQDIPYLQRRLTQFEEEQSAVHRGEDISIAKQGIRLRILAVVISVVALLVYLFARD